MGSVDAVAVAGKRHLIIAGFVIKVFVAFPTLLAIENTN